MHALQSGYLGRSAVGEGVSKEVLMVITASPCEVQAPPTYENVRVNVDFSTATVPVCQRGRRQSPPSYGHAGAEDYKTTTGRQTLWGRRLNSTT
jgi:hypothetical protein